MNKGALAGLGPGDSPDVLTGDAGQNAILVAGNRKEVPFSTTTVQAVAATDCSDYRYVSVQIAGQGGSSSVAWQCSNDGVTWDILPLTVTSAFLTNGTVHVFSATGTGTFTGPVPARYFRLNVTGIASGTTRGTIEFFSAPLFPPFIAGAVTAQGPGGGSVIVRVDGYAPSTIDAGVALGMSEVHALGYGFNGATWDRLRTPVIFKTVTATASGNTTLWTPTSGKKFRLQRYRIEVSNGAAQSSGGDIDVTFQDATTDMNLGHTLYVPAAAATVVGAFSSGWIDLGNGVLSGAINRVLSVNLSAALTAGKLRVMVAGTEE